MKLAIELCKSISSVRHAVHLSIKNSPYRNLVAGVVWRSLIALFAVGICHWDHLRSFIHSRCWTNLFIETPIILFLVDVMRWSYIVLCRCRIYLYPKKKIFEGSDTVDSPTLSDSNQSVFDIWIVIFVSIIVKRNCLHIYIAYIYPRILASHNY